MFSLVWTTEADFQYRELRDTAMKIAGARQARKKRGKSKQEGLFGQVAKTLRLLQENPRHPGLQTHEFSSIPHPYDEKSKVFEAYAQNKTPGAYRVFWCYGPEKKQITIISITAHP